MAFDFLKNLFSSNNASRDNKKEELKGRELIHAQLVELTTKCRVTIRSLTKNPESRRNITLKNVHNRLINTLDHLEIAHHSFEDVNKKNINAIIKEIQIANTIINDTSINISFTPTRNDVGSYIINFTVKDSGTTNPANATTSQIVNFSVLYVNTAPYFRYVCDNERSTTENSSFNCYINVTDIDETNNLTINANYTWFKFNSTGTNTANVTVNSTTNFNGTFIVNFTATDSEVGNWSLNISLRDTGSPTRLNSTVFYFYIGNINDSVTIDDIANENFFTSENYTRYVNATDDDLLIPDKNVYNESLTFTSNNSNVNVSATTYISGTNKTRATITFNPNNLGNGNHTINITVRDRNNFSIASDIFTIQVLVNNPPQWNVSTQTNHTLIEGTNFYLNLTQNVTDSDGNPINFSFSNNTAFNSFGIGTTTGVINFTPADADVGHHIVIINATDGITPTPLTFNFTVSNVNDAPVIQYFPASAAQDGGDSVNYTGNFSVAGKCSPALSRLTNCWEPDQLRVRLRSEPQPNLRAAC